MGHDKSTPLAAGHALASDHASGYVLSLFQPAGLKIVAVFEQKAKPYLTCATTGKARPARVNVVFKQDCGLKTTLARVGV